MNLKMAGLLAQVCNKTSAPRSAIQWTTIGLVSFTRLHPSFQLYRTRCEVYAKGNAQFNIFKGLSVESFDER